MITTFRKYNHPFVGIALPRDMEDAITFTIRPLELVDEVEPLWRSLDATGGHSFFLSWPWMGALLRFGGRNVRVVCATQAGRTVGLGALSLQRGWSGRMFPIRCVVLNASGSPALDSVMIEHNGFAVPSGDGMGLLQAFVEWFAKSELDADTLVVPGVGCGGDTPVSLALLEQRRTGFRTPLTDMKSLGFPGMLSRNARQQLRRSLRDYGPGLSLHRAEDIGQALEFFEQLKTLHIKSWTRRGKPHAFESPMFEKFHHAVIAAGVAEGTVDLLRITSRDGVLGILYNFVRNGAVSSYQSGFRDENPALRPGYVGHALAISHYMERGMRVYDYLAGSNRLKESFGIETYELCWRQYRRRTIPFLVEEALRHALVSLRWH